MRKQRWYPAGDPAVPKQTQDAFRRILDMVYENQDQLGPLSIYGRGSKNQSIGVSDVVIFGCTITAPRPGMWTVTGRFAVAVAGAGDLGKEIRGSLYVAGEKCPGMAVVKSATAGMSFMASQSWQVKLSKGQALALRISKESTASGTSSVQGENTTLTGVWQGTD
jgi:hypothetical protein